MAIVRLLGHRIGYSASPRMHDAAFRALGLEHRYELVDVPAEGLGRAFEALRADDALGANVTTPHKSAAVALVDDLSPAAAQVRAVNTVVRRDGRTIGHNTDLPAIVEELGRLGTRFEHAVVLGAGGAARALIQALREAGVGRVTPVARTPVDGAAGWESLPRLLTEAQLVVNATPVGTAGDDTPIPAALLRPDLSVLDLVYRPSPTRLVREARERGATARAGAGVLLGQGRRSLELWLDVAAPVERMRAALRAELGPDADV